MPIAYLDVPAGIQIDKRKKLVRAIYDALHEAYPSPDDVGKAVGIRSADALGATSGANDANRPS